MGASAAGNRASDHRDAAKASAAGPSGRTHGNPSGKASRGGPGKESARDPAKDLDNDPGCVRALDFEVSVTHLQERSERRAWYIAAAATAVGVLSVTALAVMVPFYRVVPLPIEVDRLTGEAQVIDVLDAQHVPLRDISDRHWIETYVRARERYDRGLLQMDYDQVLAMSGEQVARAYRQIYSGPDALDSQLGVAIQRRVRIISSTLVPDEPGRAVVHIERSGWKNGTDCVEPPQRFVITLAYTYRPSVLMRESAATANPFGFQVTAYSRDPEYTPAVPAVRPAAVVPAPSAVSAVPAMSVVPDALPAGTTSMASTSAPTVALSRRSPAAPQLLAPGATPAVAVSQASTGFADAATGGER